MLCSLLTYIFVTNSYIYFQWIIIRYVYGVAYMLIILEELLIVSAQVDRACTAHMYKRHLVLQIILTYIEVLGCTETATSYHL